jgi:hypothetical protein
MVGLFGKKRPIAVSAAVQTTVFPDVLGESARIGVNISKRMLDRAGSVPDTGLPDMTLMRGSRASYN